MATSRSRYHSHAHDASSNGILVALLIAIVMSVAIFALLRMEERKEIEMVTTSAVASVSDE
jgi:uncharacterized protein YpmS